MIAGAGEDQNCIKVLSVANRILLLNYPSDGSLSRRILLLKRLIFRPQVPISLSTIIYLGTENWKISHTKKYHHRWRSPPSFTKAAQGLWMQSPLWGTSFNINWWSDKWDDWWGKELLREVIIKEIFLIWGEQTLLMWPWLVKMPTQNLLRMLLLSMLMKRIMLARVCCWFRCWGLVSWTQPSGPLCLWQCFLDALASLDFKLSVSQ